MSIMRIGFRTVDDRSQMMDDRHRTWILDIGYPMSIMRIGFSTVDDRSHMMDDGWISDIQN